MSAYHNEKKLKAYHNGKILKAYQNGKLILGGKLEPLEITPNNLTFEGNEYGSSIAKTATVTGGKPTYSFADSVPSWLSATINGNTVTVYATSTGVPLSQQVWSTHIVDSKGNIASFSVTQKEKLVTFVIVGNNTINFTNDGGKTWT